MDSRFNLRSLIVLLPLSFIFSFGYAARVTVAQPPPQTVYLSCPETGRLHGGVPYAASALGTGSSDTDAEENALENIRASVSDHLALLFGYACSKQCWTVWGAVACDATSAIQGGTGAGVALSIPVQVPPGSGNWECTATYQHSPGGGSRFKCLDCDT